MNVALSISATRAWETRKRVLGTLYAFATTDGEHVKIGFTTDLPTRLGELSRNSKYYGEFDQVVGTAFGTFADERRIHAALHPRSLYFTQNRRGPREMYPVSVLNHPACRAVFGTPTPKAKRRQAT